MTRSTGNVFRDLGFPAQEPVHLKVRSDLMVHLQEAIIRRGLTQAEAAKILEVTQPRVSDLMRGRIDLFSADTPFQMLGRLGMRVKVVVSSSRERAGVS